MSYSKPSNLSSNTVRSTQFLTAHPKPSTKVKVGIIGGGTAGSTIAVRLAALGIDTYLFERKSSLIDGPPMCHLHAGGNLYREIPDSDCITLLKQCIEMIRLYPHSMDVRPTVIAVPCRDDGDPKDLLPRLRLLTETYRQIIADDPDDKVLGEPEDYYQLYTREDLEHLAQLPQVSEPTTTDEWMIGAAKHLDIDKLKFPIVAVQEYGWNIFRLSTSAQAALAMYNNAHILTDTKVCDVIPIFEDDADAIVNRNRNRNRNKTNLDADGSQVTAAPFDHDDRSDNYNSYVNNQSVKQWVITYLEHPDSESVVTKQVAVDYLVNACGFRTGTIDDMIGVRVDRMVEFKASYVTHWAHSGGQLPEIIIHGTRGTPHGMAQLTPYPDGHFQIHGMTKDITLFEDGLVKPSGISTQPQLASELLKYIDKGWSPDVLVQRSKSAIDFVSEFVPAFATATPIGNTLFGGQQIPGEDNTLRVADVSLYHAERYARAENIKASSTLQAADEIVDELQSLGMLTIDPAKQQVRDQHRWQYLARVDKQTIDQKSKNLALNRHFPPAMAQVNNAIDLD